MIISASLIIIQMIRMCNKRILSGNVAREGSIKQAAAHKTSLMVENAIKIHDKADTSGNYKPSYNGLQNFNKHGLKTENKKGYIWALRKVISGRAKTEYGILFPSRIIAGNICMIFGMLLSLAICYYGIYILTTDLYTFSSLTVDAYTRDNIRIIIVVACFGFIGASFNTFSVIPSTMITMLQLRSGVIPSLSDMNSFQKYRNAPESGSMILGSMMYGSLFTFFLVGGAFGLMMYSALSPTTQPAFYWGLANIIGSLIAICVFEGAKTYLTYEYFGTFHKKELMKANLMTVALECMNIGLSFGRLVSRAFTHTLMAFLYIGRVDKSFLYEGINMHFIEIDPLPKNFRRMLLLQEAHRHPYVEVIGRIYLMKLHYGVNNGFIKKSGSCWRLLFIRALMPWIASYHILAGEMAPNGRLSNDINGWSSRRLNVVGRTFSAQLANMSRQELEMSYEEHEKEKERFEKEKEHYEEEIAELKKSISEHNKDTVIAVSNPVNMGDTGESAAYYDTFQYEDKSSEGDLELGSSSNKEE
eukprot:CAMPEP_0172483404 /NCGR_PEP_ID=MMETSP1066-20121228/10399_1 /TAXON_ID=671091 /ORGANISM="Coscinodiscus wailesii, Strain CCMP2513" /LENGTH=529 /DNA_ID=CAMNT_0013247263 /DNA_START=202 /DNA_END=1791 /DNA_ORIENTATION=-